MIQFEYLVLDGGVKNKRWWSGNGYGTGEHLSLKKLGEEGWELVQIITRSFDVDQEVAFFKRPKQAK